MIASEVIANHWTGAVQNKPALAVFDDGRFIVSWSDLSGFGIDGSGTALRAQIFNANGYKQGMDFQVNRYIINDQDKSTILTLPDGRFVIAWEDSSHQGGDTTDKAIKAQLFSPTGLRIDDEILINTTTQGVQQDVAMSHLGDGKVLFTFSDASTGDVNIRSQRVDFNNQTGSSSADTLRGWTGNDTLDGLGGNDTLIGDTGNDALVGRDGDDTLNGGTGNDTLLGGNQNDVLLGSTGADRLSGEAGNDRLLGGADNDTLSGGLNDDQLFGEAGIDMLAGGDGRDSLSGGDGNDRLLGDAGNDRLDGGAGKDVLTGGAGNDSFVFTFAPTSTTIDQITDFNPVFDTILLENAIFRGLSAGTLAPNQFVTGSKALDTNDHVIYNKATGALLFDADGTGAKAAIQFALLAKGLSLSAGDFLVI